MEQDRAAPAAAGDTPAWARPWRVLLIGLGTVVVGGLFVSFEEGYTLTDAALATLRAAGASEETKEKGDVEPDKPRPQTVPSDKVPATVLTRLDALKNQHFQTRKQLVDELTKVLNPDELDQYKDRIAKAASVNNRVVTPFRLLLTFAGLLAGGWAVKRHLDGTSPDDELDRRVESAGLVAVYGLCGLVGFIGMRDEWFSGRIFFAFFVAATIAGSLLLLLPRLWRRLALVVLVLLHFGGTFVASASSPTATGSQGWVATQLMDHVYRPYLSSINMTNAYHFYAPDPGSAPLIWYRVEYADGSYRWLKFPDRDEAPTPVHYQRTMATAAYSSASLPVIDFVKFQQLRNRRALAGSHPDPRKYADVIPMRDDIPETMQYSYPTEMSQKLLESYARHVCRAYPNDRDPAVPAVKVKIYRVGVVIPHPLRVANGMDPRDDELKRPIFLGEFDPDGKLTDEDDPFLYWEIPIKYLPVHAGDIKPAEKEDPQP